MRRLTFCVATTLLLASVEQIEGEMITVGLQDLDSGLATPAGHYRWMDVADQVYASDYQDNYNYTQATVTADFYSEAATMHGTLRATNLKPNFAYQFKLVGKPETDAAANERIGLTGRWWQETWDGNNWTDGQNLNDKGDGSSPNPNDLTYYARRDIGDPTSPTGREYRYTGYLVFDYFITDENGDAVMEFEADDSYHVLWKTSQREPDVNDGPIEARTFDVTLPDPVGAYDTAYSERTAEVYGEWERLPPGDVTLPSGDYTADFILTEESFHGSGLAGGWAAAMGAEVGFTIVPEPSGWSMLATLGATIGLLRHRRKRACSTALRRSPNSR